MGEAGRGSNIQYSTRNVPESLAKAGPDGFGPSIWAGSLFDRADFALSKAWRRRFRHSFGT